MLRILSWPFEFLWLFICLLFKILGGLLFAIIGLILVLAGIILTITVVGSIVGIPLIFAGLLLIMCSLI